jgi:L-cysteine/cystine lyase
MRQSAGPGPFFPEQAMSSRYPRSSTPEAVFPMDIAAIRTRYPVVQNVIYLNSGWSGPSSNKVVDAAVDWLRWESELGPTSPIVLERVREVGAEARELFAKAVAASAAEISLLENTTEGVNVVLNGLGLGPGDEILTCNLEHGSILVPLYHLRDYHGVKVNIAAIGLDDDTDTILRKFGDAMTPKTRLIAISEISYSTGIRLPLKGLVDMAHVWNAQVLVDGAQTAGQIEIDCRSTGVDYYAMTGHKWMLGPDGSGALYVREDLIEKLAPSKISGHAAQTFEITGEWQPNSSSIQKFELTTRSPALLSGMNVALKQYAEAGAANIETRTRELGKYFRGKLATISGVTVLSPDDDRSCGLVVFKMENREPESITVSLWEQRQIVMRTVSWPGGVRASCHYFNTEEELDIATDELAKIAAG